DVLARASLAATQLKTANKALSDAIASDEVTSEDLKTYAATVKTLVDTIKVLHWPLEQEETRMATLGEGLSQAISELTDVIDELDDGVQRDKLIEQQKALAAKLQVLID